MSKMLWLVQSAILTTTMLLAAALYQSYCLYLELPCVRSFVCHTLAPLSGILPFLGVHSMRARSKNAASLDALPTPLALYPKSKSEKS